MDRRFVYPSAIPLETDLLNPQRDIMCALAMLSKATVGDAETYGDGLACTPTSPASLSILVAPGSIYSVQSLDANAYGSLAADITRTILKQGVNLDTTTLTLTAPGTVGFAQNYLVQATFREADDTAIVLPYYNASNPTVPYSGPGNTGASNDTRRHADILISAKAGTAAASGTQTTPSPDAGYIGLYQVTVSQGQTQITGGNISTLATAPLIPTHLQTVHRDVQSGKWVYGGVAGGTANALTITLSPIPTALTVGMSVRFKVGASPNTAATTLNANGFGNAAFLTLEGSALAGGELPANSIIEAAWDGTAWRLITQIAFTAASFAVPSSYAIMRTPAGKMLWQWGGISNLAFGVTQTITLPVSYSTSAYSLLISPNNTNFNSPIVSAVQSSASQFVANNESVGAAATCNATWQTMGAL